MKKGNTRSDEGVAPYALPASTAVMTHLISQPFGLPASPQGEAKGERIKAFPGEGTVAAAVSRKADDG